MNGIMDKYEIRRLRLIRIRDELCDGNVAELARKLEKADTYIHRMLYPAGKPGKKRIGEDYVDKVREKFSIDLDEGPAAARLAPVKIARNLQWVTDREADLLSQFRARAQNYQDTALAFLRGLPRDIAEDDGSLNQSELGR